MTTATATQKTVFTLSKDDRFKYITFVLLQEIINFQHYFLVELPGDDKYLEPALKFMLHNGLLEVKNEKYIPTEKGRQYLSDFIAKYFEFLKIFDVYSMVDLDKGEFAFSHAYDDGMDDDEKWAEFKNQERFSDVRVAVAEFKGLNPIEIVFMSFLQENRFNLSENGWQMFLMTDESWNEIVNICNTAIPLVDLQADEVILNIVKKGGLVMKDIMETEAKLDKEEGEQEFTYTTTTTTEEVEEYVDIVEPPYYDYAYFDPYYYDPFYISPIWIAPVIFL